jgi:chromosome segregation ATPase
MTRQCKDCVFDSKNKLREVIKDVISCVDNEHTRLEQRLIAAEQSEQEGSEIVAELKTENKKLKNKNNDLVEEIASGNIDIAILQKDLDLFRKAHDTEQAQRRILEQKLEKIKEVAETALKANYCNNCDGVGLPECGDYECHTYALDKIMNIIEGAEND